MRISNMLYAIATWLESPDNEALLLSEYNDECSKIVAESCIEAAAAIKKAAEQVEEIEPAMESEITSESLQGLADIAAAFDASNDPELKKQASVIDELLLTIAAPPNALAMRKDLYDNRIEDLKKRYEEPKKQLDKLNKISDVEKAIDKSKMTKEYRINEHALSARSCPDHPGGQLARVGQDMWQCELDKKIYNTAEGYTLNNGDKVPGGDISQQTKNLTPESHVLFDSREGRLGSNIV